MSKSKLLELNKKIEESVVGGYKKMEDGVVGGYKRMEESVVGGFTRVSDKFVDSFFTHEGETVEEAKERLAREAQEKQR